MDEDEERNKKKVLEEDKESQQSEGYVQQCCGNPKYDWAKEIGCEILDSSDKSRNKKNVC